MITYNLSEETLTVGSKVYHVENSQPNNISGYYILWLRLDSTDERLLLKAKEDKEEVNFLSELLGPWKAKIISVNSIPQPTGYILELHIRRNKTVKLKAIKT